MIVNYKAVEGSCTTIRVPCGREIDEVPDAWKSEGRLVLLLHSPQSRQGGRK